MVRGEFESMTALHSVSPNFVPAPVAWGTFDLDQDCHFFLCEYRIFSAEDQMVDSADFCKRLVELHQKSMAISPKGQFGFHVRTCNGCLPQDNTWCDSWEDFYIRGLKYMFAIEKGIQGESEEIEQLLPAFCKCYLLSLCIIIVLYLISIRREGGAASA